MKFLKKFTNFKENADASASAGMGAVSSAQPGSLPGTTGTTGSGDISFYMLDKKGKKIKKGKPSEVTDMRYLAPAKGITKLKESNSESRDPANNSETRNMINDCIIELYDLDFELMMMDYKKEREFVDLGDDDSGGYLDYEKLKLAFKKRTFQNWIGNHTIKCEFDTHGINSIIVNGHGGRPGKELSKEEQDILRLVDEVGIKLINNLDYESGYFQISQIIIGEPNLINTNRDMYIHILIVLKNTKKL
jgi:hypothetical protein